MIHLVLLAGPRGAGKSSVCQRFAARAREAGVRVSGIICPSRTDDSATKVGIDAVDASTGERRALAEVVLDANGSCTTTGQYHYDDAAMAWALDKVLTALDVPTDAVIIDEIGALELLNNGGFAPALDRLSTAKASSCLIVVRTELATRLQEMLSDLQTVTLQATRTTRDHLPARILDEIWASITHGWQEN